MTDPVPFHEAASTPHPDVPEWLSEPTLSADVEFRTWSTADGVTPFEIRHDRDFMTKGDQVEQDYNFITYSFGSPERPVQARAYLDEPFAATVIPSNRGDGIPDEVMLYLKKRFRQIRVLGEAGYTKVWPE